MPTTGAGDSEPTRWAERDIPLTMKTHQCVVCVSTADFGDFSAADLIMGKCYEVLAREDDWLRIIDESGEDYLYPATGFVPVALSPEAAARLRQGLERAAA